MGSWKISRFPDQFYVFLRTIKHPSDPVSCSMNINEVFVIVLQQDKDVMFTMYGMTICVKIIKKNCDIFNLS